MNNITRFQPPRPCCAACHIPLRLFERGDYCRPCSIGANLLAATVTYLQARAVQRSWRWPR